MDERNRVQLKRFHLCREGEREREIWREGGWWGFTGGWKVTSVMSVMTATRRRWDVKPCPILSRAASVSDKYYNTWAGEWREEGEYNTYILQERNAVKINRVSRDLSHWTGGRRGTLVGIDEKIPHAVAGERITDRQTGEKERDMKYHGR